MKLLEQMAQMINGKNNKKKKQKKTLYCDTFVLLTHFFFWIFAFMFQVFCFFFLLKSMKNLRDLMKKKLKRNNLK